ncbi:MAG TPA: hypothetical protein VFV67_20800 [Actinophytocola sp.]|uniref:beta strand repeat-containing protein n=1 Tax=Actinophytocola sp. TaxID=1872138 RepID=UPI002DBF3F15|nr:hypothetical protein [Actinophytocola sp.]HEU5473093.1 hypothetical protein [Actinophytocola sp.]
MHTWAKCGLQTALVTGGLLMLGTGIAAADEDVSPDRRVPALDGGLAVPVTMRNNAVGTPLGPVHAPELTREVAVHPAEPVGAGGNRVNGDLVVPVDVSGNAVAVGGDAAVVNESGRHARVARPVRTAAGGPLDGNVVDADWAVPVQVTGNAVGAFGRAGSVSTAGQQAAATGDIETDGRGRPLAGNVVAGQGATPVQVTGNAVSALGGATTWSDASSAGAAGGWLRTSGDRGAVAGNVAAVPLAVPVHANGNAVGVAGGSRSRARAGSAARAGDDGRIDRPARPAYVRTSGAGGLLSGNVADPSAAGPVSAQCAAGTLAGGSAADCATGSGAGAGGVVQTDGTRSTGSGGVVGPAFAVPAEAFGNALAAGGQAASRHRGATDARAGGAAFTLGDGSTAGGTVAGPAASGPVDVAGSALSVLGGATAESASTANSSTGGYAGTTGSGSTAGGTAATIPVSRPVEAFGTAGSVLGSAGAHAVETKESTAGGYTNTDDPGGFGAANLVHVPVAGPAQLLGNGAGVLGRTATFTESDTSSTAGGPTEATGTGGIGSGNIGQLPVALPAQVFGTNVTAGGSGTAAALTRTAATAGGPAATDGSAGLGAGNVAAVPVASALGVFGDSVAVLGTGTGRAVAATGSTAGGDLRSSGRGGTVAGNVIAARAIPVAQVFDSAVSALGGTSRAGAGTATVARSGGEPVSDGEFGMISGNVLDLPVRAGVPVFGVPVEVLGEAMSAAAGAHRLAGPEPGELDLAGDPAGGLPVTELPALPDLPEPDLLESDLTEPGLPLVAAPAMPGPVSRATPALSGLDTARMFSPVALRDSASLADTRARLADLFG